MNAKINLYEDQEETTFVKARPGAGSKSPQSTNRSTFGRRGKIPQSFNGMHRRRTKKIRW